MSILLVFLMMLGLSIMMDFYVKGRSVDMKKRDYWKSCSEFPSTHRHDHAISLVMCGLEWSIVISIPLIALWWPLMPLWLLLAIVINGLLYAYFEDLVVNEHTISMAYAQGVRILQIMAILTLAVAISNIMVNSLTM